MMKTILSLTLILVSVASFAQPDRWQQRVEYKMNIDMDEANHQYAGDMELSYQNNSPDELKQVFFHLYFNAFQPGSMMDMKSRNIEDPDPRIGNRLPELPENEQGWIKVSSLKLNGKNCELTEQGTILKVELPRPIKPNSTVTFTMTWTAQVPLQIRRSGWMNSEGVEFSMTQWYPKLCEYDYQGWHANPYVEREFHGVWGDFEVNITMNGNYMIGGSGVLQNPSDVGYTGRDVINRVAPRGDVTWKFKAENVHDFAWAADPEFIASSAVTENGTRLIFIHQDNEEYNPNWVELERFMVDAFNYMDKHFGKYPYSQYTFIQGGDGGMEYPMATLITGNRSLRSLVGVSVHEAAHSWYQGVLASNESLYEWMDEGFTSYATSETMNHLFATGAMNPHQYAYQGYFNIVRENKEEPLITHADHYITNHAYGTAAYSKGQVLLSQLGYVIGQDALESGLLKYFETWKFKHPNSNDFKRIMEKESGIELDWYFEYFENTTHTIDYGISEVYGRDGKVMITLNKLGRMPMPVDLELKLRDGSTTVYNIPLRMMRNVKEPDQADAKWEVLHDWPWTHPTYELTLDVHIKDVASITIDPSQRMADVKRDNNRIDLTENTEYIWQH